MGIIAWLIRTFTAAEPQPRTQEKRERDEDEEEIEELVAIDII